MPKEQLVLKQFEGGLMEYYEIRDIPENALAIATDIMVDRVGKIRMMGQQIPHPTIGNPNDSDTFENTFLAAHTPGYGLHSFGSDFPISLNSGVIEVTAAAASSGSVTFTMGDTTSHYLSIGDRIKIEGITHSGEFIVQTLPAAHQFTITSSANAVTNERFYWYRVGTTNPSQHLYAVQNNEKIGVIDGSMVEDRIDLGSSSDNVIPSFYNINDGLRVSDANFENTGNSTKWYGYIPERTQFFNHADVTADFDNSNGYTSVTSTSATQFTATEDGSGEASNSSDADIVLRDGVTMKITITATLTSGVAPLIYLSTAINKMPGYAVSEVRKVLAGTNTYYLTPRGLETASSDPDTSGTVNFYTSTNAVYTIASFTCHHVSYIPSAWYSEDHEIAAPTDTTFEAHSADIDLSDNLPSAIQKYQVGFTEDTGVVNGEFMGADKTRFKVGMSYIYLGGQESKVYEDGEEIVMTANNSGLNATICSPPYYDSSDETNYIDHRITGVRIYLTSEGADTNSYKKLDSPLLLIDVDNVKGARWWNGDWIAWSADAASPPTLYVADVNLIDLEEYPVISYRALNGYEHDNDSLKAEWKTACIANNRTYIGNVYQADIDDQDSLYINDPAVYSKHYGDRVIKSPFKKYDVFPTENFLEIVPGDGDQIVKLLEFSNRLLVFKQNTLYVVNIAEDTEIIESTHRDAGIKYSYSATETPFGPVWVNDKGCHFYDGEKVINLIEGKISSDNWKLHVLNDSVAIGYIPYMKQIIVMSTPFAQTENIGNSLCNDVYVYDFTTQSWTRGRDKLFHGTRISNTVLSDDGNMLWLSMHGSQETAHVHTETTSAGDRSIGSFSWTGGTLLNGVYLHMYNGSAWKRISEQTIQVGTTTFQQFQGALIQNAINDLNSTDADTLKFTASYSAQYDVVNNPTIMQLTLIADQIGVGYNAVETTVDSNTVCFAFSTVKAFDNAGPAAEGTAPFTGLTGMTQICAVGGVNGRAQATTITYDRHEKSSADIEHQLTILWHSIPDLDGFTHHIGSTTVSYTTSDSDTGTHIAEGMKIALDDSTEAHGQPFLNWATCATANVTTGVENLVITAVNNNQPFEVTSEVVGVTDNTSMSIFDNRVGNDYGGAGLDLKTRDVDFGTPGVRKKVYKVYLTYKLLESASVYPQYGVNSSGITAYDFDTTALPISIRWTTLALKPATSSQANNIYSFQMGFSMAETASKVKGFEVNDITVIYRIKSIK
jgi:hypothetical protein